MELPVLVISELYGSKLVYDYVDTGNPALERMWEKRQRGYKTMGYRIDAAKENLCRRKLHS